MTYDVNKVLNDGLNIVYGLTDSQIADIEQEVYKNYSEYRVELSEIFKTVKWGPFQFKKKKTIAELILQYSKTPKATGSKFLKNFVFRHAKALECDKLMYRTPPSLSIGQRYRVSLITDAIDKKMKYLYKDFEDYNNTVNMDQYFTVFNWFDSYAEYDVYEYSVIWLTHIPEDELLVGLKQTDSFRENVKLYTVENGELVNRTSLLADMINKQEAEQNVDKPVKVRKPAERQETPANTYNQKKPELEKMLEKMARRYLQKDDAELLFELLKAVSDADYYDMAIDIVNMYLSFHAGNGFFLQVKERCIQERDSLLQPVTGRETKKYFDNENVSIIVLDAQDTYVVGCSYKGKIKAGDKFVNSETSAVYTISGAIMINEKTSPDDFVLSVDTGKINRFDCIMESQSSIALKSGDLLDKYAELA